jgi:hypothetical protein
LRSRRGQLRSLLSPVDGLSDPPEVEANVLGNEAPRATKLTLEELEPGTWHRLWIDLLEGRGPGLGSVPVVVYRAAKPGPVVAVTAVVHGDEVNGTAVTHALVRELERGPACGALILVPVVNLSGLLRNTRAFFDGKDLNRSMSGPEDGRPSQRFGWRLVDRVIAGADWVIDLHTATRGYANSIYARADMADPRVERLARSFAAPILVHKEAPAGSLRRAVAQRGIPAIAVEIGDPSCLQLERIASVRGGVLRALADLEMFEGDVPPAGPMQECAHSRWLRAGAPGLATGLPQPGERVSAGHHVAHVVDVWGDVLASVRAPDSGIVLGALRRPFVVEGTRVVHLATFR